MANLTISITNSIGVYGPAGTTKWGSGPPAMTWGLSLWGDGSYDLPTDTTKLLQPHTITSSDDYAFEPGKIIDNSLSATFEMTSETLQDGSGYFYVFLPPTTEAENRPINTYTSGSVAASTWAAVTFSAGSWS